MFFVVRNIADYLPLHGFFEADVSERLEACEVVVGFHGEHPNLQEQAVVVFDGTNDTTVKFRTGNGEGDIQETLVYIPEELSTSRVNSYGIELNVDGATLSINNVNRAIHRTHLPSPYTPLVFSARSRPLQPTSSDAVFTITNMHWVNRDTLSDSELQIEFDHPPEVREPPKPPPKVEQDATTWDRLFDE